MATLFTVDLEEGDTTDFDSTSGTGLSVIAPGLVANNYCLAVTNATTAARYGQIACAGDESQVRAFFALDPFTIDPLVMADGDIFTVLLCQDNSSNDAFRVELGYTTANGHRVRPGVYTDGAAWSSGSWVSISTNEHFVEVEWNASSGAGQDDGSIELWIDVYGDDLGDSFGSADSSVASVDNDTRAARVFRLGAPAGLDAGTSGTLWLDHLTANDNGSEIGHPETLAFPRAQGAGRFSKGGRGGTVYIVSNTNNGGAGSFRAACEASGARIVVFTTDGTIQLTSNVSIDDPYISIYGQTAPGDGICLRDYTLRVRTHDVIIQHIRSRPGSTSGAAPGDLDSIDIVNNPASNTDIDDMAFNVILDHCSVSWASDENIGVWNSAPAISFIKNITVQWCIMAEGLYDTGASRNSMGFLAGATGDVIGVKSVSLHHSLFCHNRVRNPRLAESSAFEVVNNVMHDCPGWVSRAGNVDAEFNWTGNTVSSQQANYYTLLIEPAIATNDPVDYHAHQIYVDDNAGLFYVNDAWQIVGKGYGSDEGASGDFETAWKSAAAIYVANSQLSAEGRLTAYEKVLRCAGCFPRDSQDDDMVADVRNNTTGIISAATSWPTLTSGSAGTDTDSDGMPDAWEDAHGTDDTVADDDGYDVDPMNWWTNIEIYAFTSAERCRKGAISGIMGRMRMDNVTTVELEKQQRGQAYLLARQRLEQEYNCTVTTMPKWEPGVSGTFVLSFDEQVMVGPAPMKPEGEVTTNDTD